MVDRDDGDEDLDLPPLDADEGDEPAAGDGDDLPAPGEEEGGLDDGAADDLDVGEELDELDDADDDAPGETDGGVDVGALDEGIDLDEETGGSSGADDEGGAPDEEGIGVDESTEAEDAGVEGTGESPEDQVDEADLPDLDDGEDADGGEALAEALLAEAETALPPWARARLALLEGAGAAVPCRRVAALGGRVAAAGEVLLFVEEGARAARRLPFGEGVVAVALAEDALLAAALRGQLLAGRDGDAEPVVLGSWRTTAGTPALSSPPARPGASPVELAATPGRFWIRAGGALSCVALAAPGYDGDFAPKPRPPAAPLAVVRERGVLAIAASGGSLVALTQGTSGPAIERFRGDDEGGMEARLAAPARELVERGPALLFAVAAGGRCLALGDGERALVSRDGGATFAPVEPGPVIAIAFTGDEVGAPLLALVGAPIAGAADRLPAGAADRLPAGAADRLPAGAAAFLVQVSASGEAARIGELAGAEPPLGIAWDAAREVVWVASGAGLQALGMPPRH